MSEITGKIYNNINISSNITNNSNIGINILGYSSGGVTNFWEMNDTPNSYTGFAENFLLVNSTQNGIKFAQTVPISAVYNLQQSLDLKVDKINGKGLSSEDYTTSEKNKLSGIEENANKYVLPADVVHDNNYVHTDNNLTDELILIFNSKQDAGDYATKSELNNGLNNKVDKITGKGLSSEDYTTSEKNKLSGIAPNANNYVLPSNVVQDADYVHTDNNYTNSEKSKLSSLSNYTLPKASNIILGGVKVDGSTINIDSNGVISSTATGGNVSSVNGQTGDVVLSIPDQLSDLLDDSTHRTVTDSEKTNWDNKLSSYIETDPVFTAWDKSTGIEIKESQISDLGDYATNTDLAGKVDKIDGKGLSTEDYTSEEKTKLAGLDSNNYEPVNANIQLHLGSDSNPHNTTKEQVGLGNCDNTSDANKPISTATQTELNKIKNLAIALAVAL